MLAHPSWNTNSKGQTQPPGRAHGVSHSTAVRRYRYLLTERERERIGLGINDLPSVETCPLCVRLLTPTGSLLSQCVCEQHLLRLVSYMLVRGGDGLLSHGSC